jgi:pimeloyl-ACP methyl ester carboxylesterase
MNNTPYNPTPAQLSPPSQAYYHKRNAWVNNPSNDPPKIRISYIDTTPSPPPQKGKTILLIHGFPQTSHQFRHVLTPLTQSGYRIIAPDYRGAGDSSHPTHDYRKSTMARDLYALVHDFLTITEKIHVVGHDIGGMVAHAYATLFPHHVASVIWGECPLPGTSAYEVNKRSPEQFHFVFHAVPDDLAVALVSGRERVYLGHFFSKLCFNVGAVEGVDLDYYAEMYARPGGLRCAFEVYKAFEEDARENREFLRVRGKCRLPVLVLNGRESRHAGEAGGMVSEMYEGDHVELAEVDASGHYIAEENPGGFVDAVLGFVKKY